MIRQLNTTRLSLRTLFVALVAALSVVGGTAVAQTLEDQRDSKQAQLSEAQHKDEVLTTQISSYSDQISQLAGEVATLRAREAQVAQQLRETENRLTEERDHLDLLRKRLSRSLNILSSRLVDIYKSDQPDALTVILDSDGFDDLVNRYDYLTRMQDQDAGIVDRVRSSVTRPLTRSGGSGEHAMRSRQRRQNSSARACSSKRAKRSSTRCATKRRGLLPGRS